jgi:hypothetical protein
VLSLPPPAVVSRERLAHVATTSEPTFPVLAGLELRTSVAKRNGGSLNVTGAGVDITWYYCARAIWHRPGVRHGGAPLVAVAPGAVRTVVEHRTMPDEFGVQGGAGFGWCSG